MMRDHNTAYDFIKSLGTSVRTLIGGLDNGYLVYAVRSTDRTFSRTYFLEYDLDYVEAEVGGAFIVGVFVDDSMSKWAVKELMPILRAMPKYDLVVQD